MNIQDITPEQLRQAAQIKEQINGLQKRLEALLGGTGRNEAPAKGGISAAGRARISAAAKARWAKIKGTQGSPAKTTRKKRTMSAAARAKISAAAKARWAKVRAAK